MPKKKFIKVSTYEIFSWYIFEKYARLALYTGTNYAPYNNAQEMLATVLDLKSFMLTFILTAKLIIFLPMLSAVHRSNQKFRCTKIQ